MPWADLRLGPLWYEWRGASSPQCPVVVLLHGALNTATSCWKKLLKDEVFLSSHRVLVYDRRGNGRSVHERPKWGPRYIYDDTAELIALLNDPGVSVGAGPCCLLGNSDGCTIALLAAGQAPERVGCVVLCGGIHMWGVYVMGSTPEARLASRAAYDKLFNYVITLSGAHGSEERARQVLDRFLEWWVCGFHGEPPSGNPAEWDLSSRLASVRCPVLALHGKLDWDTLHGEEHARKVLAQLPSRCNPELIVFEEAGHSPQFELPEVVTRLTSQLARRFCMGEERAKL